jgi:cation:H+ antiporter
VLLCGAALVLFASAKMTAGMDRLGENLGLSEGLLGLLTALGANTPEISAAVTALLSGAHDVGYGLVLGSNLFNLAGLLGLSAVLVGQISENRAGLALHGGVAVVTTLLAGAMVLGWLPPGWTLALMLVVLLPYVVLLAVPPDPLLQTHLPGAKALAASLHGEDAGEQETPGEKKQSEKKQSGKKQSGRKPGEKKQGWQPVWMLAPMLAVIVGGSIEMVQSALFLGKAWHVPSAVVGALVLAALTGLPNVYAALRLARQGRGGAVVSETLNSNTLNLLIGIAVPAVVFSLGGGSRASVTEAAWLLGLTLAALLLLWRGALSRWGGAIIIALYLIFVAVRL